MISIKNVNVFNMENAIRGMRNPMNSWGKSDSKLDNSTFIIGKNDLKLAKTLCKAGSDHRKFMRQIMVSLDINAPLYWWKEFDTYKISTVANSESTMHTIHKKAFNVDMFSCDHLDDISIVHFNEYIIFLESLRQKYNATKEKSYWYEIIQLLPSSFNQMRTITLNYEVLINMYYSRKSHKLDEWQVFCDQIINLPYFKELTLQ